MDASMVNTPLGHWNWQRMVAIIYQVYSFSVPVQSLSQSYPHQPELVS